MSQGKKPSYVLCGQVNLHKNTECAGSLANHIYYQMRDMDVTSPGNSFDHCQQLRPNPRREGLPRTVTEWQAQREQRGDLSEGEGMTAYDIRTLLDHNDYALCTLKLVPPGNFFLQKYFTEFYFEIILTHIRNLEF